MSYMGIDIGGTKVVIVIADHTGSPIVHLRRPMTLSGRWQTDLDGLVADARDLLERAEAQGADALEAVGASVPGPADPAAGVLLNPPNLTGWQNVPIGDRLAEAFGVPAHIENDANAAALAEHRFGAGRGVEDVVYLTMSTGVGGGLVAGGRLVHGALGGAGEVGHIPIEFPGIECACGLFGCLEAYVGGRAWAEHLKRAIPQGSLALELAGGDRAALGPESVVQAALQGDPAAQAEFDRWLDLLTRGIVGLVMTLEPRRIILGTIAVAAGEALCFAPLRDRVAQRIWAHQRDLLEIVPAELGADMPQLAGLAVAMSRT